MLHRTERTGLGPAYLAGFAHALDRGAGYVLEMDADFSHDPGDLARLLPPSRRRGRRRPRLALRPRRRSDRLGHSSGVSLSRGGSWYARRVLGLDVRDLTGGFKCFRREVLRGDRPAERCARAGYAFQVELTYRRVRRGFRVVEVPIVFRDREHGTSKMSLRIAVEAMVLVPQLRRSGH